MSITISKKDAKQFFSYLLIIILYRILLDVGYARIVRVIYAYTGFGSNYNSTLNCISWIILLFFSIPTYGLYLNVYNKVSNEVMYIFYLITVIPFTVMMAFGQLTIRFIIFYFLYWCSMYFFHWIFAYSKHGKLKIVTAKKLIGDQAIKVLCGFLCLVVVYVSGRYARFRLNFNLNIVYALRMEAREFNMPTILKYFYSWSRFCIPIFMAYFIRRKNYIFAVTCFLIQMLSFGVEGAKTVFFTTVFVVIIGFIPSIDFKQINRWGLIGITSIVGIGILLYLLFKNDMVFSLFTRRMMLLPIQLSQNYFDYFSKNPPDYFRASFLRFLGFHTPYPNLPRIIGSVYYAAPNMNANNGLFADAMSNLGLMGILVMPIILMFTLDLLDQSAKGLDTRIYISVALYLAMTLNDTFFFTVLITHGLLLIIIILGLMKRDEDLDKDVAEELEIRSRGYS